MSTPSCAYLDWSGALTHPVETTRSCKRTLGIAAPVLLGPATTLLDACSTSTGRRSQRAWSGPLLKLPARIPGKAADEKPQIWLQTGPGVLSRSRTKSAEHQQRLFCGKPEADLSPVGCRRPAWRTRTMHFGWFASCRHILNCIREWAWTSCGTAAPNDASAAPGGPGRGARARCQIEADQSCS